VGVEVEVGFPLKPLSKPKTSYEVGEMGFVQQIDKLEKRVFDAGGVGVVNTACKDLGSLTPTSPTSKWRAP
jgi:hypothetical protein